MPTAAQWMPQAGGYLIAKLWVPQQMGVVLLKQTYAPAPDTHMRYADVAGHEVIGDGYTLGGKEILNRSIAYDATQDEYNMLGDDVLWGPGASFNTRYGYVYEMATADKFLWGFLDFGADVPVAGYFGVDFLTGVLATKAAAPV